jgi:hypothetical protein
MMVDEWIESLNLTRWKDKLDVWLVVFISMVLKKTDTGNGYDFGEITKTEFQDLLCSKMMSVEYDEEMKNLIVKMFRVINECENGTS